MLSIADALRKEGMQQGMQQGADQAARQIAKNLLKSGVDIAVIAKNTSLDMAFLKKLQEELAH